jgi:general secretion pathway protein D
MTFKGTLRAGLMGLACCLATMPAAMANSVTLNLKDAEINTLIATVSEVTGRNFIIDPRVKARVTVISATPMSPEGVYETFLAVLQVYGFAAIPAGEAIKIVPETNARQDGGSATSVSPRTAQDEIVTRVMQIQNVPAAQLVPILRPLVPQWGHLAAYSPSNMLIIADRAANVVRLERIIADIDRGGDREIEMIRLEHAAASEVVRILTGLGQQGQQQDPTQRPATIIADERSNAVLIGGDKSERQKFIDIIRSLDIPLADDGATQVVYLRFANAENLAPILEGFAEQAAAAEGSGGSGGNAQQTRRRQDARIIADPDTNALVITGAPKTLRQIRNVIEQLDIQRAQVLVETLIAEISSNTSSQLGLDWAVYNPDRIAAAGIFDPATGQVIQQAGSALVGGSLGSGTISGSSNPAGALSGLLGQGVTAVAGRLRDDGTSFGVLIRALAGDGDTNILSAPTLLTMDNEEAEFSVGQEVPFLTGQFTNTGSGTGTGAINPFQTIERRDVGLTLNLTPTINEGNQVRLKIGLEVSSLGAALAGSLNQITNKRTITNTVSVENGQVLILGGLIDDNITDSRSGVPFLSRIPVLGALFRYQAVTKEKRNLMLFLRPQILRKRIEADYYTRMKYEHLRSSQLEAGRDVPLIGGQRPLLRSFEDYEAQGRLPDELIRRRDAAIERERRREDGETVSTQPLQVEDGEGGGQ